MPEELIGEVEHLARIGDGLPLQATLAIRQIVKACGEPPPEMELDVQWQEHELGEYPAIVLAWEDAMRGAPWDYIQKCQDALAVIDGAEPPSGSVHRRIEQEETDDEDTCS